MNDRVAAADRARREEAKRGREEIAAAERELLRQARMTKLEIENFQAGSSHSPSEYPAALIGE